MGWSVYSNTTLKRVISELIAGHSNSECVVRTLTHSLRGMVLWTVDERVWRDTRKPPDRVIGCVLLRRYGNSGEVGVKFLCESMGPVEVSCPLSYLDMVPPVNEEWRAQVRAFHARRSRKLETGTIVTLTSGCNVKGTPIHRVVVHSVKPLIGRDPESGMLFRFKRSQIDQVLPKDAPVASAVPQPAQEQPHQHGLSLF